MLWSDGPQGPAGAAMWLTLRGRDVTFTCMNRLRHPLGLFRDRDALHTALIAGSACVLTLGLVYARYLVQVLRTARNAPSALDAADCVLLFGKHAPAGRIDDDFQARIQRALALARSHPRTRLVLLGGGTGTGPTEADLAHRQLLSAGVDARTRIHLESTSRDTLQNLRNARELLRELQPDGRVVLLSSRYHLARCALLARQLGLQPALCAAESHWRWTPSATLRIVGEAGYLCWVDLGTRWARLIGHRRMLARVT